MAAVWDGPVGARHAGTGLSGRKRAGAIARRDLRRTGVLAALRDWGARMVRRPQDSMEEVLLLVFALSMAGFVIDWALRILGIR